MGAAPGSCGLQHRCDAGLTEHCARKQSKNTDQRLRGFTLTSPAEFWAEVA